jgi:hypothetical protein
MKSLISILFLFLSISLYALSSVTPQQPDYLWYKGEKLTLNTGWGHPSPLETYFNQKNITSPFTMLSTGNYRGHVAIWEIEDNRLILKEIKIRDSVFHPSRYNIKSKTQSSTKEGVFGDWFSGVIEAHGKNSTYYFYTKNGNIIDHQELIEADFKRIQNIKAVDTTDTELMNKYRILYLNHNYISYYFRLHGEDTIQVGKRKGILNSKSGMSPLLSYYKNDHMKWPYNWENLDVSGAPICNWEISNDKLYINQVTLHSGTDFYEIDAYKIPLSSLFSNKEQNEKVFADWLTGVYQISYGVYTKDVLEMEVFKPTGYTILKINNGDIVEKYDLEADFNFRNIPKDIDPKLKLLLQTKNNTP